MTKLLFLLFFFVSCEKTGTSEGETFQEVAPPSEDAPVTFQDIKSQILEPFNCVVCHSDWATTEAGIKTKLVEGEPFSSVLYTRVENGSMPPSGSSVDSSRLEFLERYIRELSK